MLKKMKKRFFGCLRCCYPNASSFVSARHTNPKELALMGFVFANSISNFFFTEQEYVFIHVSKCFRFSVFWICSLAKNLLHPLAISGSDSFLHKTDGA